MDYQKMWENLRRKFNNLRVCNIAPIDVDIVLDFMIDAERLEQKCEQAYEKGRKDEQDYIKERLPEADRDLI
jgi:hypothetical protein